MKILLFGNSLNGMINFRWNIVKYLADQNHEIFIVSPIDRKDYAYEYKHKNVFFIHISFCRSLHIIKDFLTLLNYKKYIKKIKPDIIFSYTLKSSVFSMISNWKVQNFYFITGIGSGLMRSVAKTSNKYRFFIEKIIYFLTNFRKKITKHKDFFIFLNNDDKSYFIKNKLCDKNYTLIFPGEGIDLDFFKFVSIKDNKIPLSFLFIGRLIRDKGLVELMGACEKMKKNQINFNCTVIAPMDKYNPSSLHRMNLDHFKEIGINYISYVTDVRPYIENCDVVVLPSYSEGLPRVLLESMAIGRPIITTDVPGCRELVKNHENGFLVQAKKVNCLYDAMVCISRKSKTELAALGLAGYIKVKENYAISNVINSYQALIDNRVNKK